MKVEYIFDQGSSNEDSFLIKDNIFGVFDGFNMSKYTDENGKTGGLIAAEIVRDVFSQNDKPLEALATEANNKIRERLAQLNIDMSDIDNLWTVVLVVVRIEKEYFEWLQLTDSLILVIYQDNTFKLLVDDYDIDSKILPLWKELADKKEKDILKIIIKTEDFKKFRAEINESFGALDGQSESVSFLKKGKEDLTNIKHILLFTDGIFLPKEDPKGKDDWNLFVKLFLEGGLKKVKEFVRDIEKDDPYCWKYPRFKKHDDIAAISISF